MSGWIGIPVLSWENLSGLAIAAFEAAGDSCQVSRCDACHACSATDLNHYFSSAMNIVKTVKDVHHIDSCMGLYDLAFRIMICRMQRKSHAGHVGKF